MFLVNNSTLCSGGCEFARGGGLAVGAILSYFFAGCLLCIAPNPENEEDFIPPQAAAGHDQVKVEKTTHADGSVTVTKTTTHPDGSKTVEETTEGAASDMEAQGSNTNVPVVSGEPVDPDYSNLVDAKGY